MAAFEIVSALPSQRLDGAGRVEEIMIVGCVTEGHGISFQVEVPKTADWRDKAVAAARAEADELEAVFGTYS